MTTHLPDEELVAKAKAGDKQAFVEIFNRYKNLMYTYVSRYTGDPATAEDLTIETFLGVYNGLARYEEQGRFLSWVYGIATNLAKRALRNRLRHPHVSIDEQVYEEGEGSLGDLIADERAGPDGALDQGDVERIVRGAMSELDSKYKDVLMLCDVEGMQYNEAAAALKMNAKTVGTQLRRARKLLYEKLKKYKDEFRGRLR